MAVTFRELEADGSEAGDEERARGTDTETSVEAEVEYTRQANDGDAPADQASDRRELDERTLRQQVAVLERLVRAERRRNQAVIDHYERVLEEREAVSEQAVPETETGTETESLLERVLSRLG